MRVTVRFSLDGDDGSVTTTATKKLKRGGFSNKSPSGDTITGTWISPSIAFPDAATALTEFLGYLKGKHEDAESPVTVDHLWVYCDGYDDSSSSAEADE